MIRTTKYPLGLRLQKRLEQNGFYFNNRQQQYLRCLIMEDVFNKKKQGVLLEDVDWEELDRSYIERLAIEFAPRVSKIKGLE